MLHHKNTKLETIDEVTEEIASTGSYFNEEVNNIFTPEVTNVDEQNDDSKESEKKKRETNFSKWLKMGKWTNLLLISRRLAIRSSTNYTQSMNAKECTRLSSHLMPLSHLMNYQTI